MAFFKDLQKDFTKLYKGVEATVKKQLDLEEFLLIFEINLNNAERKMLDKSK